MQYSRGYEFSVSLVSSLSLPLRFPATATTSHLHPNPNPSHQAVSAMAFAFTFSASKDQKRIAKLLDAAHTGNLRALKKKAEKLDRGKGIADTIKEIKCPEGHGVFCIAAGQGRTEICQYLVEDLGLPVDFALENGETPLLYAAKEGRTATVRYLLDHGANPTSADKDCTTPLHFAAENGHGDVVKLLLSRGVPVDLEIHCASGTPLHFAARFGHESTIKILLEHNADVNKILNGVFTPLNLCITVGSFKSIKLLIEAGADPNLKCPLGRAVSENDVHTVRCLLEAGADPDVADDFGFLPIETAAMGDRRGMVEMLFPLTTPIPKVKNWSVAGIIKHVNTVTFKNKAARILQKNSADMKKKADDAFRKNDYQTAIFFYSLGITTEPENVALCSNRSLCFLCIGDGKRALHDAKWARQLSPSWPKVHYRVGAAFMMLKEYASACRAYMEALQLDPTNEEIQKAFWEAHSCMEESCNGV